MFNKKNKTKSLSKDKKIKERNSKSPFQKIYQNRTRKNNHSLNVKEIPQKTNCLNLNVNPNKKFLSLFSDNMLSNNNQITSKKMSSSKIKSNYTDSKSGKKDSIKGKLTKRKTSKMKNNNVNINHKNSQYSKKFKTDKKIVESKNEVKGFRTSAEYFAKEEKEDCVII